MQQPLLLVGVSPGLPLLTVPHGVRGTRPFLVGRSSECQLVVKESSVSRRHAEVVSAGLCLDLRDLGSTNGTFVNGTCVSQAIARCGDEVKFGVALFVLAPAPLPPDELDSRLITDPVASGSQQSSPTIPDRLSAAEGRVFGFLVRGASEKEIAAELRLSPHTVHCHVRAIYRAFGVHSRAELMAWILGRGLRR